ncbi:Uncharacterised protein [Porphyromonas cangingivalis]|uniref:Uncharacterized protein n=2 Tax=Porphyromonas cangingivalis TaxID=36874 RepID=A0A1T4M778_PORCN|nr:hypothetical protein SAMN02745205_01398 [Porphyromonas cangingivalis]VEJ02319.1 Uncharacterised protein [Porphyromonas cangingivalis]
MVFIALFLVLLIIIFKFLNKELSAYKDVDQGEFEELNEQPYVYDFDETEMYVEEARNYETKPKYDYNREEIVMKEAPRSVPIKPIEMLEEIAEEKPVGVEILGDSTEDLRRAVILSEILQRKF